ncbi:hypothetical protein LCGC14_1179770 [marine sediment metagenome]|uniref:Uncharacterized protein n=1 Tax=marine sediment metagenome TaxID=412755 RepID=A0A0F9P5G8_9ZZZZ
MDWELREVDDVEATLDGSGLYVVINRVVGSAMEPTNRDIIRVRADLMTSAGVNGKNFDEPIMSFIGTANNVRKHLIAFLQAEGYTVILSHEHASYIGYELHRAETDEHYVQD